MNEEKRKGESPIPGNVKEVLNEEQTMTLRKIEGFGWQLRFIRRPLFQAVVPVVVSSTGDQIGVLEEDGRLNLEPTIGHRGSE